MLTRITKRSTATLFQHHLTSRTVIPKSTSSFINTTRSFTSIPTPHIPELPVLNTVTQYALAHLPKKSLTNTAIVYIHHALYSSLPVLSSMFKLGLSPQNTFVLGKHYSECKGVVEEAKKMGVHYQPCSRQSGLGKFSSAFVRDIVLLWESVARELKDKKEIRDIIIMDHGGHAVAFTPVEIIENYNIVGIEKTTAGLLDKKACGLFFPLIAPALCAAKRVLESPCIADAVVAKLIPLLPSISATKAYCAVLGYGAVGKAVADKLLSLGHRVVVYDCDPNQLKKITGGAIPTNDNYAVIGYADYIFGCSGRISLPSFEMIRLSNKNKVLISASSEDKEFLPMLEFIQRINNRKVPTTKPLADVVYTSEMDAQVCLVRGGFPINFDDTGESVPAKEIDLTRSLNFMSVLQAIDFLNNPQKTHHLKKSGTYMLYPALQSLVATEWLKGQPAKRFPNETAAQFLDEQWIVSNSGGTHEANTTFKAANTANENVDAKSNDATRTFRR